MYIRKMENFNLDKVKNLSQPDAKACSRSASRPF